MVGAERHDDAHPATGRAGWALPARPPESWVGGAWSAVLLLALSLAVALPVVVLVDPATREGTGLAVVHVLLAATAATLAWLLLVEESVADDRRLRWVAGGAALVFVLALLRAGGLEGAVADGGTTQARRDATSVLGLLLLLVLPLAAAVAGRAGSGRSAARLAAAAVVVLAALPLALPVVLPDLVRPDGTSTALARALAAGAAALTAAVAVDWWARHPVPLSAARAWVGASLVLMPAGGVLRAMTSQRYDGAWWASAGAEVLALAVPTAGLGWRAARGYFRQSRRWHQLERRVQQLHVSSPLLPGRSVTPEDEEGLPTEVEVKALIASASLRIALQPVVELATGRVVGHEALTRVGGRVPVDRWFRAASRHGLAGELERVCLAEAVALQPQLGPAAFLAVNVSPAALADEEVLRVLHDADLPRLVVEVTEHEAVADYPQVRAELERLRGRGARVAVDDTGAGFASLRHVLMLQPDIIKLDTSLVRGVDDDERQRAIVRALVEFAAAVGSTVLAEGVEHEEQAQALRELGVPVGQGWHLGVPEIRT